jgi:uncharacterized protein (DUF2062 family)
VIGGFQTRARRFIAALLKEKLEPGRAAAAVFVGIFIGIVPIYGFQTLAAVGAAMFFGLNKPVTVAGTFINNPLLQPLIIWLSVELGYLLRSGSFRPLGLSALTGVHLKEVLVTWAIGSVPLGVLVGGIGAATTAVVIKLKVPTNPGLRDRVRFVKGMFAQCPWADREFVRWKLRLDRIFGLLAAEDLGSGTVVDLGCGYGMALSFAAFADSSRHLVGCDLDGHRGRSWVRASASGFDPYSGCLAVSGRR